MTITAKSGAFTIDGDLTVNRLGYGAMRITGKGVWGMPEDEVNAKAVLKRAVELGVSLIDTSDAYGPNTSEELIAEALFEHGMYPEGVVVATKGGLTRPGPGEWVPDGRPEHMREAVEGSLERLHLERIDLYQLHRIDPKVPVAETIGALADLQKEGKIRHIGLSEVTVEQIEEVRKMVEVATVQNIYNLSNRTHESVLKYCEQNSIGFIPWYPLNTGKLTEDDTTNGGVVADIATRHGATVGQIALAWLLKKSPVILPIPGTASLSHLEENMAAADIELSDEEFDLLENSGKPLM